MVYILSAQRNLDDPAPSELWAQYQAYLQENKHRFPPGAFALATSDRYFSFTDHRAPHDAWLESATLAESASGERNEVRSLTLRVKLLGAYHDHWLEFFYPRVFSYVMENPVTDGGHVDWHYDEFRLSEAGNVIHEIEWTGSTGSNGRWVIEASDVVFTAEPKGEA